MVLFENWPDAHLVFIFIEIIRITSWQVTVEIDRLVVPVYGSLTLFTVWLWFTLLIVMLYFAIMTTIGPNDCRKNVSDEIFFIIIIFLILILLDNWQTSGDITIKISRHTIIDLYNLNVPFTNDKLHLIENHPCSLQLILNQFYLMFLWVLPSSDTKHKTIPLHKRILDDALNKRCDSVFPILYGSI